MKKILLTISAIAGFVFVGLAQDYGFEKGNVILEGSLNATSSNQKSSYIKSSEFNFYPKAGFFVSDNFALGLDFQVGSSSRTTNHDLSNEEVNKGNTLGGGIFGRYYFLELGSRFKTYTELSAKYNTNRSSFKSRNIEIDDIRINGFNVNAGIGANFFLTDKIAINFSFADVLRYGSSKVKGSNAGRDSYFVANLNNFGNFFATGSFGLTFKL